MRLFSTQREFTAYGPSYWAVMAVFAIGSGLLIWVGRLQTESQAWGLGPILGAVTTAICAALLVYSLMPPTFAKPGSPSTPRITTTLSGPEQRSAGRLPRRP
jgi:hypothetical protein